MTLPTPSEDLALTRRHLIMRDSIAFFTLALITLALFAVTLFLFRSFTAHRAVLAARWLDRGKTDLARGRSPQAVSSLQVALDYAPGDRETELLLAQALAAAGHLEQSTNYLTELWETEPGSGVINLRLARNAVLRDEQQQAINSYRAAIYGTWEGDGVERRREVRLELARYLLSQHEIEAARAELLVAGGNTIGDPHADMTIAGLLEQANDPQDALRLYLRGAQTRAAAPVALADAGRIAFHQGDYRNARHWLSQALHDEPAPPESSPRPGASPQLTEMLHTSEQIAALTPSADLPVAERVSRILELRAIAHAQLASCVPDPQHAPPALQDLVTSWSSRDANPSRSSLLRSPDRQNALLNLSYRTALALSTACTVPPETDAQPLLLLAHQQGGLGS